MAYSGFYETGPSDPRAPVPVAEYQVLRPGDRVVYVGPITAPWPDDHLTVIDKLIGWPIEAGRSAS